MRTSTLLLAAATAAIGMGSAYGQVFSENVVGYINVTAPKGLSMIANPLDNKSGNKVKDVLPKAPNGALFHKFNGTGYDTTQYFDGWDNDVITLEPGSGGFLFIPSDAVDADRKLTLVGEVQQKTASNLQIPNGLSISSSKVPQAGKLGADLKFPIGAAMNGSIVYKFVNSKSDYDVSQLFDGFDVDPQIEVAEAFFVLNTTGQSQAWNRDFVVQ
jgi:hypothetical protein